MMTHVKFEPENVVAVTVITENIDKTDTENIQELFNEFMERQKSRKKTWKEIKELYL